LFAIYPVNLIQKEFVRSDFEAHRIKGRLKSSLENGQDPRQCQMIKKTSEYKHGLP
jgi:hypothetical protein